MTFPPQPGQPHQYPDDERRDEGVVEYTLDSPYQQPTSGAAYPQSGPPRTPYGPTPQQGGYTHQPVQQPQPINPMLPNVPPRYVPPPPALIPPGDRPTAVTAAALLMILTVATTMLSAALVMFDLGNVSDDDRSFFIGYGVVMILVALCFIGLTLGVLRGRQGARVTAYVMYGLFLMVNGCIGIVLMAFINNETSEVPWQANVVTMVMLLVFIVDIVIIVLLSVGSSHHWFKAMSHARRARLI